MSLVIPPPGADEHAPYYAKYVALVGPDALEALVSQARSTAALLAATPESLGDHRHAPAKWTVKDVVGHLADAERVFAYRALRVGRGDTTDLPGFDEDAYVPAGRFDRRTLADLAAELATVRVATLALFRSFDAGALARRGTANGQPISVRALAGIIAGHERHHVGMLRDAYGLKG